MPFPAIHPALDRALVNKGYAEPTPVQAAVLDGHGEADMLVSAQTGSGKTVAFGLAAASTLLGDNESFGPADAPLMLAIAPTRELALQVSAELEWLYGQSGAKITTCVGGMDARKEARALNFGIHIVVGTPGRLKDHIDRGNLDLSALRVLVLDEADEMLDMGFREDLEYILEQSPPERRTLLFSATIARDIALLAKRYQRDAVRIDTVDRSAPHSDIEYRALRIAPNEIEHAVVNVLRFYEAPGALVFCSTRDSVRHLQSSLLERGFSTVSLSGEMGQRERTDALQALRDGRARVCVATDVAARGLDLPDLGLVIHAELPINKATMLHRSGRTGRAGKKGVSILLVPHTRRRKAEMLLNSAGVDATWAGAPTAEEILAKDETRLLGGDIFEQAVTEEDMVLARRLMSERTADEIAAALIRVIKKDLPAPEDLLDPGAIHQPRGRDRSAAGGGEDFSPTPWPGDRLQADEVVWFRMDVGRNKNADPKWLIPLICRVGHITKKEIGAIRTFPDETRFEIAKTHEGLFRDALKNSPRDDVTITPSEAPTPGGGGFKKPFKKRDDDRGGDRPAFAKKPFNRDERTGDGPRPDFKKKPYAPRTDAERGPRTDGDKPYAKKPFGAKPGGFKPGGKPAGAKPFNKAGKPGKRFD
ncbi:ATP-dependent RNA helicase DeaD [Brevundimonas bullata]|uniref:ATP-dependent RNA helicase DeaD n=1 Tax=Brevundimonas bullata TaxID=13160 RepID=A0A7W7ILA6_9CAUL|nr:DEAD/DEAH box helicase [Brevundimonas bullata]MBB4796450.1 ATP-dependent RNA helicase DeaD [Brevundimonas bullata]MBB6381410.1 ATP-dependent RNA helicase DeaD [Brevundimonas bullata]